MNTKRIVRSSASTCSLVALAMLTALTALTVLAVMPGLSGMPDPAIARETRDDTYWITRTPMPMPRQEVYPDLLEGRIYLIGGFTASGSFSNRTSAYELATDTWFVREALPALRHHIFCVAHDGLLYAIGGFYGNWYAASTVYAYDPDANQWTTRASLPGPRGELVAASFGDRIFVFGGRDGDYDATATTQVYDPASDSWEYRNPMPTARAHSAVAVVDDLIYVIGGRYGALTTPINMDTNEVYSPVNDQWYTLTPIPDRRGGHAAAAHDGKIYIFGGENLQGEQYVFDTVLVYDPALDSWDSLGTMPTPRHGTAAVAVGDTILVIGGADQPWLSPTGANEGLVIPSGLTAVDQPDAALVSLIGAYPNPFNPRITVEFVLPQPGRVTVSVHDLGGRLLKVLAEGQYGSGQFSLAWDGRDSAGRARASGAYFIRLEKSDGVQVEKVTLVR